MENLNFPIAAFLELNSFSYIAIIALIVLVIFYVIMKKNGKI